MAARSEVQTSLPPAQPSYVFRGHTAQVHCVRFVRQNSRLLTGDADGWVILWKLASKRPVAVWRPHDGAILGFSEWGAENIISHGRDNALKVWQLRLADEERLSTVLPTEKLQEARSQPWLLHSLGVNTLNFCSFSTCLEQPSSERPQPQSLLIESNTKDGPMHSILVAVPGTDDKKIDIFQLPSERRIHTVPRVTSTDTGMVMSVKIVHHPSRRLLVLVGYESGHTAIHQLEAPTPDTSQATWSNTTLTWHLIYLSKPHSQPALSLDIAPDISTYFTSSADAIIAAHRIPDPVIFQKERTKPPPLPITPQSNDTRLTSAHTSPLSEQNAFKISNTKHAGQQSLRVRSDGRILATAGWDGRVRVYSAKSLKEVAVLKWHRDGVYGVAFAEIIQQQTPPTAESEYRKAIPHGNNNIDSIKTVPKGGCADSYASISPTPTLDEQSSSETQKKTDTSPCTTPIMPSIATPAIIATAAASPSDISQHRMRGGLLEASGEGGIGAMKELERRREAVEGGKHWIAAGGKDGKVSLWIVY